jgi:hypothetical protein
MKIEKIIHPYITKMKHTNCHINLDLKKVTRGSGSWEISRYIFVLLLCWRSECNQIEHIKRPSQKILVYLKGMLLDEILPSQKARGTLKNETPACMDISLLKMPDLCFLFFSSWYSVVSIWVSQEKINFLLDHLHWVTPSDWGILAISAPQLCLKGCFFWVCSIPIVGLPNMKMVEIVGSIICQNL